MDSLARFPAITIPPLTTMLVSKSAFGDDDDVEVVDGSVKAGEVVGMVVGWHIEKESIVLD